MIKGAHFQSGMGGWERGPSEFIQILFYILYTVKTLSTDYIMERVEKVNSSKKREHQSITFPPSEERGQIHFTAHRSEGV